MGGFGSGQGVRPNRQRNKFFIEEFKYIDAGQLPYQKMQLVPDTGIQGLTHGVKVILLRDRLHVIHDDPINPLDYSLYFEFSYGHYGNYRYWFKCPSPNCQKRCRKLFFIQHKSAPLFLCRTCLALSYKSQNCTYLDRVINKKWKIINSIRLNCDDIDINHKPKWMHWAKFHKKLEDINRLKLEATFLIGKRLY